MGVKSLWALLTPVGRPVMLETVEGKAMAIDSSIWIYQFQATMRDKEGHALINAHVLGFLRRISKLLFYGIKPVFVFDGGAPVLKRTTLNERKQKKTGAALSHVKIAEKLLAAQMRREALKAAQGASAAKGKSAALDENTVYLEDLEGPSSRTPKNKTKTMPPPSSQMNKYRDHDPYRLPQVDLEETIAKATRSTVPDPRLATEEELRIFIEEMRPEDFDINSPAFRELPTEIQYEIVGDLRLKSRQTSYARLQKMLQTSQTPLDFSKQQIQNLRQRNALTQQLLITTDSIGSAHIAIPVRIASERNKQYVLVKNENESGGWILGIQDTGTREKPITIDHDEHDEQQSKEDDSDADMEEVQVQTPVVPDPDLRDYQREMALSAHDAKKVIGPSALPINRKAKSNPVFVSDYTQESDPEDDFLAVAIQRSLEETGSSDLEPTQLGQSSKSKIASTSYYSLDDIYTEISPRTRLDTAISIAGTSPSRARATKHSSSVFGKPSLLSSPPKEQPSSRSDSAEAILVDISSKQPSPSKSKIDRSMFGSPTLLTISSKPNPSSMGGSVKRDEGIRSSVDPVPQASQLHDLMSDTTSRSEASSDSDEDIEMEEIPVDVNPLPSTNHSQPSQSTVTSPLVDSHESTVQLQDSDDQQDDLIPWSRTPSPTNDPFGTHPHSSPDHAEEWDAVQEMDVGAEEGEFARFVSQVKGRSIDDVRKEIDDEIQHLNSQRRAAMRDSEDITQQMITQIMTMLRLFGIPYMTAPMEAEAQCAELLSLNLVDGVITDDSDVFLFGAQRVYKNMFNQSKTVECFLISDLSRELGLDRDTLIRLAYLLGSDYTEGLPGVGPVVAMELLKEFPGRDGLHKFKDWWTKVQSGKDREEDSRSKFRRQFKKKFKNLYLPSDWPNSIVRDAYYHPTVDTSEESFKWGTPDLDGLRLFLHQELGWKQSKVDELLLPIIQRINKRNQTAALNKQGNLNEFLDISAGSGTHAPRQRQAYASRRLQQVISDFRKRQRTGSVTPAPASRGTSEGAASGSDGHQSTEEPAAKKTKTKGKSLVRSRRGGRAVSSSTGKGSRTMKGRSRADANEQDLSSSDEDSFVPPQDEAMAGPALERELRPRPKPRPAYRRTKEAENMSTPNAGNSDPASR